MSAVFVTSHAVQPLVDSVVQQKLYTKPDYMVLLINPHTSTLCENAIDQGFSLCRPSMKQLHAQTEVYGYTTEIVYTSHTQREGGGEAACMSSDAIQ